jgi:hypothetical protein
MTTGVLPWDELVKKLNLNTGFFETSQYELDKQMRVIAGNYDGAGLSAGNMQYNFGTANRLTELFDYMFANYENKVEEAFGGNTPEFQKFKEVCTTYTRTQKVAWGDEISIKDADPNLDRRKVSEPWVTLIGNLMVVPECYSKYAQMMDTYYLQDALFVFRQMSCTSRMSLASFFDVVINKGRYYPVNTLQVKFDEIDADTTLTEAEKETQKIYQINYKGNEEENALNDNSSTGFWTRRGAMANMGGDYFGALYDPENQFDMNLEPAMQEKVKGEPVQQPTNETVDLGLINVENLCKGGQPITSVQLVGNVSGDTIQPIAEPFTTTKTPETQFRTNPNGYGGIGTVTTLTLDSNQPLWVDVRNFVACKTYYTTDGSEPSAQSNVLKDSLKFTANTTLKTKTISIFGVAEETKTLEITVSGAPSEEIPQFWRYIRYTGYGDQTGVTSRLVELQAIRQGVNLLLNKLPLAGYPTPNGGAIEVATDGTIAHVAGYPFWWSGEGIPVLTYDLGDWLALSSITVVGYSPNTDPRQTQFKIDVSADNATWYNVANYENNTTPQPEAGFGFAVAFA